MFEWGIKLIESVGDRPERLVSLLDGYGFKLKLLETGEPVESESLLSLQYGNVVAHR
jgi:hypothetical protein